MFINCKGIVIREFTLKENNKILTILTDTHGKLTVTGFRAKSMKSSVMNTCQLFCYSEFVLELKNDKYKIHSAELLHSFYSLRNDLNTLSLAQYFMQISENFAQYGQECTQLLRLILNTLHLLCIKEKPHIILKAVFELKLIQLSGFEPNINYCSNCSQQNAMFFSVSSGAVVCKECKIPNETYINLTVSVVNGITYILKNEQKKAVSFTASEKTLKELAMFCERYVLGIADRSFKALKFYNTLI